MPTFIEFPALHRLRFEIGEGIELHEQPLPGGLVQLYGDSIQQPLLDLQGDRLAFTGAAGNPSNRLLAGIFEEISPLPNRCFSLRRGWCRARLESTALERLVGGLATDQRSVLLTENGLTLAVAGSMLAPDMKGGQDFVGALQLELRFEGRWEYRLPAIPRQPEVVPAAPLSDALEVIFSELYRKQISVRPEKIDAAVVQPSPWRMLELGNKQSLDWEIPIRGCFVEIAGRIKEGGVERSQTLLLRPQWLAVRFKAGTARYQLIEHAKPLDALPEKIVESHQHQLELELDRPGDIAEKNPIRAKLQLEKALDVSLIPAAPPRGKPALWLRSTEGWLHLVEKPGAQWAQPAAGSESRAVDIGEWLEVAADGKWAPPAHGARIDLQVDRTAASVAEIEIRLKPQAPNLKARVRFYDPSVRISTGRHLVMPDALENPDLPPFAEQRGPEGPASHQALVLESRTEATPEEAFRGKFEISPKSPAVTGLRFRLALSLDPDHARVTHWRQFRGLPLSTPLAWAKNDRLSAGRPSPIRGLVPLVVQFSSPFILPFRRGWFEIDDGDRQIIRDPTTGERWSALTKDGEARPLRAVSRERMGLELDAARTQKQAALRIRYAVPELDEFHRAARPNGLKMSLPPHAEHVVQRFVEGGAAIEAGALDRLSAAESAGLERMLDARREYGAQLAPKIEALETREAHQVVAGGATWKLLAHFSGPARVARRWSVRAEDGSKKLKFYGLPIEVAGLASPEKDNFELEWRIERPPVIAHHAMTMKLWESGYGLQIVTKLRGRLEISTPLLRALLGDSGAEEEPAAEAGLIAVDSAECVLEPLAEGSSQLRVKNLRCWFKVGAEVFCVHSTAELILPSAGPARLVSGESPRLEVQPGDRRHIVATLTHQLPGFVIVETFGPAGRELIFKFADSAGHAALPVKFQAVGNSLYVTGAEIGGGDQRPVMPIRNLGIVAERMTRCHARLVREKGYFRPVRMFLGWTVGSVFGLGTERDRPGERHATLVLTETRCSVALSGIWFASHTLRCGDEEFVHDLRVAVIDHQIDLAGVEQDRFRPRDPQLSVPMIVQHDVHGADSGARINWCAVQRALWSLEGSELDLSGVFAIVREGFDSEMPAAEVLRFRPGLTFERARGVLETRAAFILALPCLIRAGKALGGNVAPRGLEANVADDRPEAEQNQLIPRGEWRSIGVEEGGAFEAVSGDFKETSSERVNRRALSLIQFPMNVTRWVDSRVLAIRPVAVEAREPPTIWIFGAAGMERLHVFPEVDPRLVAGYYRFESGGLGPVTLVEDFSAAKEPGKVEPPGSVTYSDDLPEQAIIPGSAGNRKSAHIKDPGYISFLSKFIFHEPGDATFELWVKPEVGNDSVILWSRADDADESRFLLGCGPSGTTLEFFGYRPPAPKRDPMHAVIRGVFLEPGKWSHVAVVRSDAIYQVYVNGESKAEVHDSEPFLPDSVGWSLSRASQPRFQGWIDEVRLTRAALRGDQLLSAQQPKVFLDRARAVLAGARWHEAAVLEYPSASGPVWALVDSPLLNHNEQLGFYTGETWDPIYGIPVRGPDPTTISGTAERKLSIDPGVELAFEKAKPSPPAKDQSITEWVAPHWTVEASLVDKNEGAALHAREDSFAISVDRRPPFALDYEEKDRLTKSPSALDGRATSWGTASWAAAEPSGDPSRSGHPFVPRSMRFGLYCPRPGEHTAYGLSGFSERGKKILPAAEWGFVDRSPLAVDFQEKISHSLEVTRLGEDAVRDAVAWVRSKWTRRHPSKLTFPSAENLVALAVHSPVAPIAAIGERVKIWAWINHANLQKLGEIIRVQVNITPEDEKPEQDTILIHRATDEKYDRQTGLTLYDAAAPGGDTSQPRVWELSFYRAAKYRLRVMLQSAVKASSGSVLVLAPSPADDRLVAATSSTLSIVESKFEPPPTFVGVVRFVEPEDSRLVAFGPDAQAGWEPARAKQSDQEDVISWVKLGQVDELVELDLLATKVRYRVFTIGFDGGYSQGDALPIP